MSEASDRDSELRSLLDVDAAALYDEAPTGHATLLPSGEIVKLNRTLAQWLGFEAPELIGERLQSMMTIGGRIYFETHCRPLLAMQGYLSEVAIELQDRGGNIKPVLIAARVQRGADDTIRVIRVTAFDATERRRYERELLLERKRAEESLRIKAELIRMLSHDVRSPLSTIRAVAALLESDMDAKTRQRQLDMLNRATNGIIALIDQILEYERIDAKEIVLELEPLDLRAQLGSLVEQHGLMAANKGIDLVLRIDDDVPARLDADPVKFGQILDNLISNAIKFTETGSVTVSARLIDDPGQAAQLELSVRDSGIGIEPDRVPIIFEAFKQANVGIRRDYGGSGLGLAICRRLVALHGGTLQVDSTPGAGSRFWFTIGCD